MAFPALPTHGEIHGNYIYDNVVGCWNKNFGDIEEEGSNYIKFKNGKLMQWGQLTWSSLSSSLTGKIWNFYYQGLGNTFPVPFVGDLPVVTASMDGGAANPQNITLTSFNLTPYSYQDGAGTGYWMAIGRWK